jgi:predicted GNAT superfamily acetyltransferase
VEIRPLEAWDEFTACQALQREVWGEGFEDVVPASLLKVVREIEGVVSGAFHPDEGLVGFVFGLAGTRDGRAVHWSHMLAVRDGHRGRGLGRRLKEHQRRLVLEAGISETYWTFDPLVARNAHFNLNRLGVRVVDYAPQMYGETGSRLHEGLGTDRFVVVWDLKAYEPGEARGATGRPRPSGSPDGAPDGLPAGGGSDGTSFPGGEEGPDLPPVIRVEVPSDIHAVRDRDPAEAARWRERTREAFLSGLDAGYRITGFVPGPDRGFYVLVHGDVEAGGTAGDDGPAAAGGVGPRPPGGGDGGPDAGGAPRDQGGVP